MNFFDVLVSSIQDPQAGTQKSDLEGIDALLGSLQQNANSPQALERTLGHDRMEQMVN
jgi:hypothetical protein